MKREGFSIATVKHNLSKLPVETVRSLGIVVGVAAVGLTGLIWIGQGNRIDWRTTIAIGSTLAFFVGSGRSGGLFELPTYASRSLLILPLRDYGRA